jgi:hypothetical protein
MEIVKNYSKKRKEYRILIPASLGQQLEGKRVKVTLEVLD